MEFLISYSIKPLSNEVAAVALVLLSPFSETLADPFFAAPYFGGLLPRWLDVVFAGLVWLWFINLFNFMDGVDGMLASNSIVFSLVGAFALFWLGHDSLAIMLILLGASLTGFLVYNWPPARVFMGDSGAAFIGYTIAVGSKGALSK